jgi:DNA invertase Pin-like site-specific DNA recombinase
LVDVRKGDNVVLARIDALSRSLAGFGRALDLLGNMGVTVHLCEIPGCVLDPTSASRRLLVEVLKRYVERERRMTSLLNREVAARLGAEGRRRSRFAPYGFKWERRGRKTYMAPVADEQLILRTVTGLRAQGYSLDQIRQYLNYEWRVRNRRGNDFGYTSVRNMAIRGAELSGN